ncbi:hypothetical protein C2E23DRAFT_857656 [Lenzites betulinus]|nr:hypothetical protein C2E23DRAFT_857656 [Lenzites betulinus]
MPRVASVKSRKSSNSKSNSAKCTICDKRMARSGDMARHMERHSGTAGDWLCPMEGCLHRSRQKSNMMAHINTHTNKRNYKCDQVWIDEDKIVSACVATFADGSGLCRHRRRQHKYDPECETPAGPVFRHSTKQQEDREVYTYLIMHKMRVQQARTIIKQQWADGAAAEFAPGNYFFGHTPEPIFSPIPRVSTSSTSTAVISKNESALSSSIASLRLGMESQTDDGGYSPAAYAQLGMPAGTPQQPQPQNFVDTIEQENFLLPSQIPMQFFSAPPPASFSFDAQPQPQPMMNSGTAAWQFASPNESMGSGFDTDLGYDAGMDNGAGLNSVCGVLNGFDIRSGSISALGLGLQGLMPAPATIASEAPQCPPLDNLFVQQPPKWDSFYAALADLRSFSPSGSSSITSSPTLSALEEYYSA